MRQVEYAKAGLFSENFYALYLSISKNCIPEQAFTLLETGKMKRVLTDADTMDMMRLREEQGCTFRELSEMYGISDCAVLNRINSYKKKQQNSKSCLGLVS
jgi:predicted DNA-binding protein (UPF0251 family)